MVMAPDVTPVGEPVQPDGRDRFRETALIADPMHGYVEVTRRRTGEAGERDLLDTPWLQRLSRVRQLQSASLVFPAGEHSRYVHLLGAMHLASLFARRIDASLRQAFPDTPSPACVEETLRLAGLLHDVGHGPFGHFFDQTWLSQWGIDHEDVGRHIVLTQLGDIISGLRSSPSGRFAPGESIDPMWVAWVMADADIPGYTPPRWLRACKPVLCGPATVDNLDYVPRDAHMCGVSLGPVDVRRLIHYTFVHQDSLVLHSHAAGALEMFLASRLYMYTQVYHHRTQRRLDLSMREIFADTVRLIEPTNPLDDIQSYVTLEDWLLLETVRRWQSATPGSEERRLGERWQRLLILDLPWHLAFETIAHRGSDLSGIRERILGSLPDRLRDARIQVDVASARIAPNNPMDEDGFVAIFDPLSGRVERTRAAEIVARLPQHNQLVRIFTDDVAAIPALHEAARAALS
jgi:HD superfamily phosphohydrolase